MTGAADSGGAVCAPDVLTIMEGLMSRHGPEIYRLARVVGGSDVIAEEVSREVLLALLQGGDQDPAAQTRRARREAVEGALRRRLRWGMPVALEALLPRFLADGHRVVEDPAAESRWAGRTMTELLARGGREAVERGLDALPDEYRIVVALHDQAGLATRDVAEILDRPRAAVDALLHRGRLALREQLCRHFAALGPA